jgi:hypothetical protein
MGIIWSLLPSIQRNTMCCVNVTTRKACWEKEISVNEMYKGPYHHVVVKKIVVKDNTPANEVEFGATVDVYAPVDTASMLREANFDQMIKELK